MYGLVNPMAAPHKNAPWPTICAAHPSQPTPPSEDNSWSGFFFYAYKNDFEYMYFAVLSEALID